MKLTFRSPAIVFGGVFLAAVIGCALGCTIAMRLALGERENHGGEPHGDPSATHAWLHETLGLEAGQIEGLDEIEARFAARQAGLEGDIAAANLKLAEALKEDRSYSPRVEAAVDEIHKAQAELQKATVEHIVEMETVLTPAQFQQLLEMAAGALGG